MSPSWGTRHLRDDAFRRRPEIGRMGRGRGLSVAFAKGDTAGQWSVSRCATTRTTGRGDSERIWAIFGA